MKLINKSEIQIGDIIAKDIVLHNRKSYEVIETPKGQDYVMVYCRQDQKQRSKRLSLSGITKVYLLHRGL